MKTNKSLNITLIAAAITSVCSVGTFSAIAKDTQVAPFGVEKKQIQKDTRYIVVFKEHSYATLYDHAQKAGVSIKEARLAANTKTLSKHSAKMLLNLDNINGAAVKLSAKQVKALAKDNAVAYVEEDPIRYLIGSVEEQAITPMAESTPYGVRLVQADQVSDANTGNMSVCIMDTGYEGNHEDLNPYTSSLITGSDNDGAGNDTGNWWQPGHNHGTHVAGTIGALGNNGRGVTSVNPSGLLRIHNVKVFNNAGSWGYGSDLVRAIGQCQQAGSKVINMSLGGSASSNAESTAFQNAANAGVLSIAAAGNSGDSSLSYPASYNSVVSVAAVDSSRNKASFSQYNSQVEIAAPGVSVNSTVLNNGYSSMSGTSMASPHAAGVAALVWSHYTNCSAAQIRAAMGATAQDLGSAGRDNSYGYGLIQAKAMYDSLAGGCGGTDPDPDPDPDPTPGKLVNGVPQTNLSGAQGSEDRYTFEVPAGATNAKVVISGGSGDADLYTRFGAAPTTSAYDCRPYVDGNSESCSLTQAGGTHHVLLRGYSSYSGVTLSGSYTDGSDPGDPIGCNGVAAWNAATVYLGGDRAVQSGSIYQANWWNQNQSPVENSGQWSVWTKVGSCN